MGSRKHFTPHVYQTMITDHILDTPRCAIWAGMGMGKSCSTLNAISTLQLVESRPTLVLAPLRVARSTWPDEARKWSHLSGMSIMPIVGTESERRASLRMDAPIYTTNYEQIPWLVEHYGDKWPFGAIVADEATRLKGFRLNQGTQRAKALAQVAHKKGGRFIELTGTPSPNGLQDLWGQAWFLDAGHRLGRTYGAFKSRWFYPHPSGFGMLPQSHALDEIKDRLKDICLTVDPKDWFDLKDPIVTNVQVQLPVKARALYRDMERQMFMELEQFGVEAVNAAARTVKCLQIANGAAYVDEKATAWREIHDAKLQALESIIEEAAGMPVLVSYQFRSDLERLLKAFPRGRHLDKDPKTIADWNAGKIPVLFAHPMSAGHGLSLQDGGNILVFFGLDWNLENRLQIIERIGPVRQLQAGYDRPVFIYNILASDTVDEMVLERVVSKREIQDILLDAMKRRRVAA